jgi:UDP-glucose 4-epimerase
LTAKVLQDQYRSYSRKHYPIIDIPPKLGEINREILWKINLLPFIEKSTVENVIFISSTSVYGDENDQVTEETTLNPIQKAGQLEIVETLLQNNSFFKTTVLRLED